MLIVDRQQRLLDILRDRRSAGLDDLAGRLGVSASTVRRDLNALAGRGLVERTHGGAVIRDPRPSVEDRPFELQPRMGDRLAEKRAIGRAAAELVRPGMTVMLDGGSTVVHAARQITARPLQVVTHSLAIAHALAGDDRVELLIVGGRLDPRGGVMLGPITRATLADLHADLAMLSLAGLHGDAGYNVSLEMVEVQRAMMAGAAATALLMDSSKFDRVSRVRACGLDRVHHVLTDPGVDPSWRRRLGDRLIVAEA
jgi:DeoR/GlpR family transcriptional regulator of sugar metabolism